MADIRFDGKVAIVTGAGGGLEPIPIIALSANAMHHQVAEYLGAGMTAHVAKPIDFTALCAAIQAALDAADAAPAAPARKTRTPGRRA